MNSAQPVRKPSLIFMQFLRKRLKFPVTLLMFACTLSWSLQSHAGAVWMNAAAVVVSGAIDTDTRVIRLNAENATADLKPGMPVSGAGIPPGSYIVQILSGDQILINQTVTANNSNLNITFDDVTVIHEPVTGTDNWTKNGTDKVVLVGTNTTSGTFTINDGIVQVGGVNFSGRTVIHDVLSNTGALVFGSTGAPTLNFASNVLNTAPFERVGSLAGGSDAATILLTGGTSNAAFAFGGNNATTTFTGSIISGVASTLLKEGDGVFTWINNNDTTFNGSVQVDSGGMIVGGTAGLGNGRLIGEGLGSNIIMSNKNGASLTLASGGNEVVGFLSGGGFGTTRLFPNGSTGALLGNYLNQTGGNLVLSGTNLIMDNNSGNQVYAYGGIISGTGNLTKVGNNTFEVLGINTYAGQTTVQAFEVNNSNSAIRLGAYGTYSGVGANAGPGYGALPSGTRLLLAAGGQAGNNRNVTFDLNGATQTLGTLNSANVLGTKTVLLRGGELTIHTTTGNSSFYDGLFSGRGVINVTATTGANGWELRATDLANNNAIQRGTLNVLGGTVSLNDSRGALGDAVHVKVTGTGTLSVLQTETVGSLSGDGQVSIADGRTLVLSSGPAGSIFDHAWTGTITGVGTGGVTLAAGGSLLLKTDQAYLGTTRVSSAAALYLDYSGGATNLIPGTLNLNGGSLYLSGGAAPETLAGGTTLSAGASLITTQTGEAAALFNLGNLNRNAITGGALLIKGDSATTTSAGQAGLGGILGGYATHRAVVDGSAVFSWAVPGAGGTAISGLQSGGYSFSFGSGLNTDASSAITGALSGPTGSLRFNTFEAGDLKLTIGGAGGFEQTLIESGGILMTPAFGARNAVIEDKGGGNEELLGGGAFGVERELIVHQHNTRGTLTIAATIANNGDASRLTKTGPGTLILTKQNTYTGQTGIYGGVLQVGNGGQTGTLGTGSQPVVNHGYLVINRNNPLVGTNTYTINQVIEGTGTFTKKGTGTVELRGDNTYKGPTQVLQGVLNVVNANNGLGGTEGLTSVSAGATLRFSSVVSPETLVIKGGTLAAGGSGGSSLNGDLLIRGTSNVTLGGASTPLTLNGRVFATPGSGLNVTGAGGRLILSNAANELGAVTIGSGVQLFLGGAPTDPGSGSVGRADIINNGTLVTNMGTVTTNPALGQFVLGNRVTGSGSLIQMRNTLYLTADNTYTGTTLVGGNLGMLGGVTGLANGNAELRVGADTYTGSFGTGAVTLQSASNANSNMRFHLARNAVIPNTININPHTDGTNARNAVLLRQGTGTINLSGVINAGFHLGGSQNQRATLQSETGGRLIISGTLNNGPDNRLNIINNGFVAFEGVNDYNLWGVISGNNSLVFRTSGTTTIQPARDQSGALVQSMTSTSNTYLQLGTLIINSDFADAINDNQDFYVLRGATLQFNYSETIGALLTQKGSNVVLADGVTLTMDDNITRAMFGGISGNGDLRFDAVGGTAWYGLLGSSSFTGDVTIGSDSQITTVRVDHLADAFLNSALGAGGAIHLGIADSTSDARLEYVGVGHSTDRAINLAGGENTVRIAGNGRGALVLNGEVTVTSPGAKTLMLHGQSTMGNTINGLINENGNTLTLVVNPNVGDNDMYGAGTWKLTNPNNNFSGNVSVGVGALELAGSLGNGGGQTSVLGNLDVVRTIDLGVNNFNGRRYAFTGGGDNLGATGGLGSTGALIFNDPATGTATFGSNITFTTGDHSSNTGAGHARLVNNGNKVIVINGNLTTGAGNNRNWYLDGGNTGTNTVNGIISNGPTATVSLVKEGSGTWRITGANTFSGAVTITRGVLEIQGGSAIGDAANVNLSNAGSEGSSVGSATLRVLTSETIGSLQGAVGTGVEIVAGQTLRLLSAASQTYNGVISGEGGLWRDGDGTARIQTLTNFNTYTGATAISSTSNIAHRIDVLFLADGGQASGIGASSNAASNLVFNLGTGNGGLRWFGTTNQTTDRLFTIGAGAGAANIWADGQLFGDFAPSIKFTNTGPIEFLTTNTNQTLTLRGARISENELSPQITNNGTGVTSLAKSEAGLWILNGANSYGGGTTITGGTLAITHSAALGTGPVTINGVAGVGLQLRGSLEVSNPVENLASLGGIGATGGDSRLTGGLSLGGTNANFVVSTAANASLEFAAPITGTVGTARLALIGQGEVIFSAANSYQGRTSVSGSTLILDYDASNTNKLNNGSSTVANNRLELGFVAANSNGQLAGLGAAAKVQGQTNLIAHSGGTLVLKGGSFAQVVNSTTFHNGANRIIRDGGTSTINLGTITRTVANAVNDYGTVDFSHAGIAFTNTLSPTSTGGILASTSTNAASGAYATIGQEFWATTAASGSNLAINAFTGYVTTFGTSSNTSLTAATTTLSAATTTNSLRFNANAGGLVTLAINGNFNLSLVTGGILVTKNVTDNVLITGGNLQRSATTANLDTIIHHHGSGTLTIASVIKNNSTGAQAFTKTGAGLVVLAAANDFSGRANIQQGVLQVGDGTAATASATLGRLATATPVSLSEGATLRYNVANPAAELTLGVIVGGGLLHLAPTNTATVLMASNNANWLGDIWIQGGTLRIRGNANALGNLRGITTIDAGGVLDLNGATNSTNNLTFSDRITINQGGVVSATQNGTVNTSAVLSGVLTLNTASSDGATFSVAANSSLTLSNMIRTEHGFTKSGNGFLTVSGNQFQDVSEGAQAGATTPNINPALLGQVQVAAGELRLGNARALGAVGVGNETVVSPGASLDLRGQALNWADYAEPMREVIHVSGAGFNGSGALRNSTGTGVFSHLVLDGDATLVSGGYAVNSRLLLDSYDINPNTGSVLDGNFTRVRPTIEGNNRALVVRGNSVLNDAGGAGLTLRDPRFLSPLQSLEVAEGLLRIEKQFGPVSDFSGLTSSDITQGIRLAYAGQSFADPSNQSLGLGPVMGARLNFWNNWGMHHTMPIIMDGATAAANGGHNTIDIGGATIPNSATYLDGGITLIGSATRNFFNIDSSNIANNALVNQSANNNTIVEQGNLTGAVQAKLVVRGQITGSGGLTKTGTRELRLTANNTFTGDLNVLRSGTSAVRWQDNTITVNGVDYQTHGDAEGWAEWGLTLAGADARISAAANINLQRRGMLTLDNTTALDATSRVAGGNHNDRINNAASLNFENGWMRIIGGEVSNTEALATAAGARLNVLSGSNFIDLMPTAAGTSMTLTIGEIARSPGSVLTFRSLDSRATFGSAGGAGSTRVLLTSPGTLAMTGAGTSATSRSVVVGLFGGVIPHTLFEDTRSLGHNNANASDEMNQARNLQFLTGSHFMTYDGGVLRPLDDSEYFIPQDGLIDTLGGATGQNVNLLETFTRVRENTTINSLRFGPLADNNGSGGSINDGTRLTSYVPAHNIQLYVDGTLNISSGMISSAYFTAGNTSSLGTFIIGGTLNFGNREAIINNQNGMVRFTDGAVVTGNLEIRSVIAGSAGLLKTGIAQVVLDGANTYRGRTTISNGTLFLRNGRQALGSGGAGNGVVIEGSGGMNSGNGIQVGSPAAFVDILVKPVSADVQVMRVENDTTSWYSNVTIDNVDLAGLSVQTPRISAANSATSIIHGNIHGGSTSIVHNLNATLSRIVQVDAGNNAMIFRGQFGDKADIAGNAVPIADTISSLPSLAGTRTNQNEVLRVTLAGSLESNFFMERQYNAVGRLTLNNGNMIITYDPARPGGDGTGFWTNAALGRIPGADSTNTTFSLNSGVTQQGFAMGVGSIFLTRPDQHFNMTTWSATGNGAKYVGGLNTSGTVLYGNPEATGILTISNPASTGTPAPVRAYAAAGGTVVFDMVLQGNPGTAASLNDIGFAKIGRGTVILNNSTRAADANSDFDLGGGVLVLDHSGQNRPRLGSNDAILNGGVLHVLANPTARTLGNYGMTNAANNVFQLRSGGTEVIAESRGQDLLVTLGNVHANNGNATLTRAAGAVLNLVTTVNGGGVPSISLNFNQVSTALARGGAIPWLTYGTQPRKAEDFGMIEGIADFQFRATRASSSPNLTNVDPPGALRVGMVITGTGYAANTVVIAVPTPTTATLSVNATAAGTDSAMASYGVVELLARETGEFENSPNNWTLDMNVSETGAGYSGTLTADATISTLRFNSSSSSQVLIGEGRTLSLSGGVGGSGLTGGILVSSNTGAANKAIAGGDLTGYSTTYTGTTTGSGSGANVITNVSSTAGLRVGMPVSGPGIPAGAFITALSADTITLSSPATVAGTNVSLTSATPELVFHQYGQGLLDVGSRITGGVDVTISGPSSTGAGQLDSTGVVRFAEGNTYTGRTIISGAVLQVGNVTALGVNPSEVSNNHLTLNGGTFRWTGGTASLQNRGVRIEGNGGVIDVVNSEANLIIGTALSGTQAGLSSQDVYRGDLIKTGQGVLTLLGNQGGFNGLLDIRQGTLIAMADSGNGAAGTSTVFGGNRSFADGTILRHGANIQLILGNGNNSGDWTIDEHFVFEGGNTFTYGGLLDVNANLAASGVLDGQFNIGNRRPLNLNGMINLEGAVSFVTTNNSVLRLGNSGGYIMGGGDIIKDGPGQLHFRTNTPDWTGNLIIREGSVYAANQADVLGTGHLTGRKITLGDIDRQGVADLVVQNPDSISGSWIFEIHHDIDVVYNPVQTKRLGIDNISNGNRVTYYGDVTLNDNLILLMRDVAIAAGGEQAYVNFNGSFKDGAVTSGNLLIQSNDSDTTANNLTTGRTYGYAMLSGDNSAWTGDVTISSNLTYNQDNTAILRLAHAKALTEFNEVVMNHNSILQAGGQKVTIGSLSTLGGSGAYYGSAGTMSSNLYGSSEIIENAAATPGTLRIYQATPSNNEVLWDAFFRDGTLNSQFLAPGANILQDSAALNLVKAGGGWATLSLHNEYSGSTVVEGGVLQVGLNGIGSTGRTGALGTTVNSGAVIAGSGLVQGRLTLLPGGVLKPGDLAGNELGTLSVDGDAIFSSGSQALMQIRTPSYNNPGAISATDPLYAIWRNGVTSDSFSNALADLVTPSQHDMLHSTGTIRWGVGTKVSLVNDGYTPKAGDIFRLFSGSAYDGVLNVGSGLRLGGETGTDLDLFELGGNFLWDVSLFNSHGILMVVEADSAPMIIPPPVITSGPSRTPAGGIFEPGESVTLNVAATGAGPLAYQWYLNGVPLVDDGVTIQGSKTPQCVVVVNFNTKGVYSVSVANEGGVTVAPTSVLVEVNDIPFIAVQPTPRTVNPGVDVTFTVLASGQEPFLYQWRKDGEDIEGATSQNLLLEAVAEFDEGVYSVVVQNAAGQVVSDGALLSVNDPVTFALVGYAPFPRAHLGETVTFTVNHDGTPRDTGAPYSYQWRKGGTPISGGTGATLVLTNVNAMAQGNYDVVVTNGVNSLPSAEVNLTLLPPAPVVEVHPVITQTLLSGDSLTLAVQAGGRPPLTYTWKLNNSIVASGPSNTLLIPKTAVSHGGIYVCEVTNSTSTKAVSNPAEVVVVDSGTRLTPVGIGETAVLVANVGAGPATALQYLWYKNGEEILEEDYPEITGIREKTLTIPNVTLNEDAFYTCEVKGPADNSVTGCTHDVRVFADAPQMSPFAFTDATIYADYYFEIPFNRGDRSRTPSSVTATGLPPGLVIDNTTGIITGRPNKIKKGGYAVKVVVANSFGSAEHTATLLVNDLSLTMAGDWTGIVDRNQALNTNLGGRMDFKLTALAAYSGRLMLGGVSYSFKGILEVGASSSSIKVTIPRKGRPAPPPLELTVVLQDNKIVGGTVSDGDSECDVLTGWRSIWGTKAPAQTPTAYMGYHTFGVALPAGSPLLGDSNVPQGSGYGAFTVARNGKLKIAGRMPDGEAMTAATFLGPDGGIGVFQPMYKSIKPGGSLLGTLEIDNGGNADPGDNMITGTDLTWVRPASIKATDRTYRNGFGVPTSPVPAPVPLAAVGGVYKVPDAKAGMVVLDMPMAPNTGTNNAEILFSDAGDLESNLTRWNPSLEVSIGKASKITTPKKQPLAVPAVNPAGTAVKAAAKTGVISGGFTLEDRTPEGYVPLSTVKRGVKFQGVIIWDDGRWVGVGYFLLPQLPQKGPPFTTVRNSPILSGLMLLEKL